MWTLRDLIVSFLLCVAITKLTDAAQKREGCPRGWNVFCDDENKCVKPMSEFEDTQMCLRRGGVPGVMTCLKRDNVNVTEKIGRLCIKDLKNGKFGFAKNLQNAMAKLDKEEKEGDPSEDEEIQDLEAPIGDIGLSS